MPNPTNCYVANSLNSHPDQADSNTVANGHVVHDLIRRHQTSVSTHITRIVGVSPVLRLSIVVPHQDDDALLERTLLSVLENRTRDQEVIVVHNGCYFDPYQLGADEVVMLETPKQFTFCEQLNLAFSAACSRNIEVLFPGTTVSAHWADEAIDCLESDDLACVGIPCEIVGSRQIVYGLEKTSLPRRRIASQQVNSVPLLNGTVFRKRVLQLVGGLYADIPREGAELELQLLFEAMELPTHCMEAATIVADTKSAYGLERGYETGRQSGLIAASYGKVEGSGVTVDSLAKQLAQLASGLMNPKSVAERLGWVMGTRDHTHDNALRDRLLKAASNLDEAVQEERQSVQPIRRAA
jgi:hypothetical protein